MLAVHVAIAFISSRKIFLNACSVAPITRYYAPPGHRQAHTVAITRDKERRKGGTKRTRGEAMRRRKTIHRAKINQKARNAIFRRACSRFNLICEPIGLKIRARARTNPREISRSRLIFRTRSHPRRPSDRRYLTSMPQHAALVAAKRRKEEEKAALQ